MTFDNEQQRESEQASNSNSNGNELHFTHYFKKSSSVINALDDIAQARLDNLERKNQRLNSSDEDTTHRDSKNSGNLSVTTENTQLILEASQGSQEALYQLQDKLKEANGTLNSVETIPSDDNKNQTHQVKNLNSLIKELSEAQNLFDMTNKLIQFRFGSILCMTFLGVPALADFVRLIGGYHATYLFLAVLVPMFFIACSNFSSGSKFEKQNQITEQKIKSLQEQIIKDGKEAILFNEKIHEFTQNMNEEQKEAYIQTLDNTCFTTIEHPEVIYDLIAKYSILNVHNFKALDVKEYFQTKKKIKNIKEWIDFNCTAGALSFIFLTWLGMIACDFFTSLNFFNVYHFIGMAGVSIFSTTIIRKLFLKKYKPLQALNEKLAQAKAGLKNLTQYFGKSSITE